STATWSVGSYALRAGGPAGRGLSPMVPARSARGPSATATWSVGSYALRAGGPAGRGLSPMVPARSARGPSARGRGARERSVMERWQRRLPEHLRGQRPDLLRLQPGAEERRVAAPHL